MVYGRPFPSLLVLLLLVAIHLGPASSKLILRLRADSLCPMPGYYRDETDCRKFYRCAEHATQVPGQSIISKVEFNCPQGTIYDEALSSCNHISMVRDVPPSCDTSNPVIGSGGSNNMIVDNTNGDISPSSSGMPSTDSSSPNNEGGNNNNPSSPDNGSMSPEMSQPPMQPQMPPSNIPVFPIGNPDAQPPLPMLPGLMPGNQEQQPNQPISPIPGLPMPGNQEQQPNQPISPIPGLPMPGNQEQQPNQPISPIPGLPMPGNQDQQPPFPAFPGFPMPGNQNQPPAAISVPVMQGGGQQQQQQLSFPSFSIPTLPGGQQFHSKFPFNFNMYQNFQQPSLSLSNIPGISPVPVAGNQLNQQNYPIRNSLHEQNNLSENETNSSPAIAVPLENQNVVVQNPSSVAVPAGWIYPQKFTENSPSSSSSLESVNMGQNQGSQWVVPNNFPTFYSVLGGGRTPILVSGQHIGQHPTASAYIIV